MTTPDDPAMLIIAGSFPAEKPIDRKKKIKSQMEVSTILKRHSLLDRVYPGVEVTLVRHPTERLCNDQYMLIPGGIQLSNGKKASDLNWSLYDFNTVQQMLK